MIPDVTLVLKMTASGAGPEVGEAESVAVCAPVTVIVTVPIVSLPSRSVHVWQLGAGF